MHKKMTEVKGSLSNALHLLKVSIDKYNESLIIIENFNKSKNDLLFAQEKRLEQTKIREDIYELYKEAIMNSESPEIIKSFENDLNNAIGLEKNALDEQLKALLISEKLSILAEKAAIEANYAANSSGDAADNMEIIPVAIAYPIPDDF
jgi:hypothetical protein